MPDQNNRRQFFQQSAVLAAGGILLRPDLLFADSDNRPGFRISLAEWSLHRSIFDGRVDHLNFARIARREFDIDAVEFVNQFFKDKATDQAYLRDMKTRSAGEGVRSLLIMIDGEGHLGAPSLVSRTQAVENHYKWVEAAKFLGCHSIRVNAASAGSYDDQVYRAADGLRSLTEFADPHGINVIVENHGGLSSNGHWLSSVIKRVDHPRCGTLPDFGNFRIADDEWYNRYQGVLELIPFAKAVSAKSHDFDDAGDETRTDYLRMMKIVRDSDYRGYIGIEYEGSRLGEFEGILATKRLLDRVFDQLA